MEIQYHITATKEEWIPHYETYNFMAWEETETGITVYTVNEMQTVYETALDATGLSYTKQEV